MAIVGRTAPRRVKMAERAQQMMEVHFPGVPEVWLWHRKTNDGFITIPRTLPIVMQAVDAQSKGQPAGHTLFCLWARSPDHPVLTIENPVTIAAEAGFMGERAVDTWRRRMKTLRELHFIQTKPGPSGEFHYVLLMNPNAVIEKMRADKRIQDDIYARFLARVVEIGAYGEVEAVRAFWAQENPASPALAAAGAVEGNNAAALVGHSGAASAQTPAAAHSGE